MGLAAVTGGSPILRYLCVAAAFFFTLIVAAGCVAEVMGSPTESLPFMMIADRVLAAGCLVACGLALFRITPALILIWVLVITHGVLCAKYDPPGQLVHGVLRFAVAAAIFLTAGWGLEKVNLESL
jgi:hypothetical protein